MWTCCVIVDAYILTWSDVKVIFEKIVFVVDKALLSPIAIDRCKVVAATCPFAGIATPF